jgi:hypothetical protein
MVLAGSDIYVVSPLFVSGDIATDPASTPTVACTRADGTVLAAPVVDDPTAADGLFRAKLLADTHVDRVDVLSLVWSGTVDGLTQALPQTVEVVGGRYVSVPELRTGRGMNDAAKYPTLMLAEIIDGLEQTTEDVVGVAFVPRYQRDRLYGDGSTSLMVSRRKVRSLISVTIDDVAADIADFTIDGIFITYTSAISSSSTVIVEYSHGLDVPPADLRREVLRLARQEALGEAAPLGQNIISQQVDGISTQFGTPNPTVGRWTGDSAFDAVLTRLRSKHRTPGFA